jgi:hypothetical protein
MDEVDPVVRSKFKLRRDDLIATAGSCFAQHIARRLSLGGFNYLVTETVHPLIAGHAAEYNYGTYTARYGNIYTARQLLQTIRRAYGDFVPHESVWRTELGRFVDPFRPQIQPRGFASCDELLADRAQHLAAVRRAIETLDVFVFTLGLTEAWVCRTDGAVLPLCPGVAGGVFDEAHYGFINLTTQDVITDLTEAIDAVLACNPHARVLLTVSPVPLVATMENRSVLVSTTYSKAVLRVAAEEVAARYDTVAYFPSYEVVTGNHTKGSYFAPDLRSVTEAGVAHVMRLFMTHYTDIVPLKQIIMADRPVAEAGDDDDTLAEFRALVAVMCDEETLDMPTQGATIVRPRAPMLGLAPAGKINLALGKSAEQSSRSIWSRGSGTEDDAVGALSGKLTGRYQFHTSQEQDPWWCLDLGEAVPVVEIRLYNRCETESLAARLLPFTVLVSLDRSKWSEVYRQADGPAPGVGGALPLIINFGFAALVRYVKVQKAGFGVLHLDQLEVYAPA